MKNKKAMLLTEETLKIVIAVIGIGLLIYLLIALYFNSTSEKKLGQANAILKESDESIKAVIDNLDKVNPKRVNILAPQGWFLFSFVDDKKPNSCVNEVCLCICPITINVFDKQIKKCDEKGVCLAVPDLIEFEKIKIKSSKKAFTSINIEEVDNKIKVSEI